MTKTEQKLLDRIARYHRAGYDGRREAEAARKLEAKGLIKRHQVDGTYFGYRRDGSVRRGYRPQGWMELI